jgi:uncharacterized membrane protein
MYDWLKFLHVAAATVWVGGTVLVVFYGMRLGSNRSATTERRIAFAKDNQAAGVVFTAAALLALAFGMWMVADAGIGWGETWITFGFTGIAVGAALGMGFYGPQNRKLIAELEAGDPAARVRAQRIGMVSLAETVVLLVVVWAMVFKPGA